MPWLRRRLLMPLLLRHFDAMLMMPSADAITFIIIFADFRY
jgi:hypothetical protein